MIKLTAEQNEIFLSLRKFYISDDKEIIIDAPGGTGKSTIITILLEKIIKETEDEVLLVGPTHSILDGFKGIPKKTIYSFLGLTVNYDGSLEKVDDFKIKDVDVLVVDESSMIPKIVVELLNKYINKSDTIKVIYLGDSHQLPPVGENLSKIFQKRIKKLTMEKNMRSGNYEIIKYRNFNEFPEIEPVKFTEEDIINIFKDGKNPIILCWTNNEIERINGIIVGRKDLKVGDIIVVRKTHLNNGSLLHCGKRFKITKIDENNKINEKFTYDTNNFSFGYAMTVHKAQGLGFNEVYINYGDLKKIKEELFFKKAIYTAVSRTKDFYKFFVL